MSVISDRPVVVIPADFPPMVGRSDRLNDLREFADVQLYSDRPANDAEMLRRLKPADILLNSRSAANIGQPLLDQLPKLKMIAVCGIGYDAIDVVAANRRGVVVSNIPGRTATVVAEHAFSLMLAVSRRMATMTHSVRNGEWPSELGTSLIGKRAGIIGTGSIGCEMIRLCRAFGMEVVAWSFHPNPELAQRLGFRYVEFDELLATSDAVSVHLRLSDDSRGLMGEQQLRQMKAGSILINTARGAIVDAAALADALKTGRLFGAGIDVYETEPVPADNVLLRCKNVVLTPHSADQTPEGLDILTQGCVENIRAFLNGTPQNVILATS